MHKRIIGAVALCLIGLPALADDGLPSVPGQSQSKLGSLLGSMREKLNQSRAERAERAISKPNLFSRSRAALSGAASKMRRKPGSGGSGPLSRLSQGNPVRPWKSTIPIQRFW